MKFLVHFTNAFMNSKMRFLFSCVFLLCQATQAADSVPIAAIASVLPNSHVCMVILNGSNHRVVCDGENVYNTSHVPIGDVFQKLTATYATLRKQGWQPIAPCNKFECTWLKPNVEN